MYETIVKEDFSREGENNVWTLDTLREVPKYVEATLNWAVGGDTDSSMMTVPPSVITHLNSNEDEIVEFADMVADLVNQSFPKFCMDVFNCPPDRSDIISTAREVVSDKSFFLTKKRYIMHVINDEGEKVDKLKVMGVELIKSDTSIAIKTILWEFVNLILDGGSSEEIMDLRRRTRLDWDSRWTYKELATPLNTKSLQKVIDTHNATGSLKGAHYSARAALFWNDMCGRMDKPVSAGEKIGLIYIKHPKSKYIGFPIDMQSPPSWWNQIYIDYDREWQSAEKKIENYLTVLGLDILSRKQEVAKSMFNFGFG